MHRSLRVLLCVGALGLLPAPLMAQHPGRDFVRLVYAYRLRQFQSAPHDRAPSSNLGTLTPATIDRRALLPRRKAILSQRIQVPFPGPLELSVDGRVTPLGAGSSIRFRLPLRLGLHR
jgi:hypothetical protein